MNDEAITNILYVFFQFEPFSFHSEDEVRFYFTDEGLRRRFGHFPVLQQNTLDECAEAAVHIWNNFNPGD